MENKSARWWDVYAVVLLLIAFSLISLRISATEWTDNISRVEMLTLAGAVFGILLGKSIFDRYVVRWIGVAYGLFFVSWQLGSISTELTWAERLIDVYQRSGIALIRFLENQPTSDTILFLLVIYILYWITGITGGYLLLRYGKPWFPLALAALILLVIDFNSPYVEHRDRYTGVFVLVTLLIIGRLYYLKTQRQWMEKGVAVEYETGLTIGRSLVVSGFLVVLFAWNLPLLFQAVTTGTEANQVFTQKWSGLKNRLSNAFAGLDSPILYVYDFYAENMSLGTGTPLGEEIVFSVQPSIRPNNFHYYWRGYSYDYYDGAEWSNTVENRARIQAVDWPLPYPEFEGRQEVSFVYRLGNSVMRPVSLPSMIRSFDQPGQFVAEEIGAGYYDLVGLLADPTLQAESRFKGTALIAVPTIQQLREAEGDYPQWVIERYLQLPEDFPDSVVREGGGNRSG
jgi:hypothetical protein